MLKIITGSHFFTTVTSVFISSADSPHNFSRFRFLHGPKKQQQKNHTFVEKNKLVSDVAIFMTSQKDTL